MSIFKLSKSKRFLSLIFVIYIITTLVTVSRYLINWDAGQFALGTENFSLKMHQPHPPGYPLFILAGKIINLIFHDVNLSLLFVSFLAGGLSVFFTFQLIKTISRSSLVSFWLNLFFVFSPLFWFYRSVALTYTFDALAVSTLSYFTYQTVFVRQNKFFPSLIATAVLMGFRPSIILVATPLLVWQFWAQKNKAINFFKGLATFSTVFTAWFIPFVIYLGGWEFFFAFLAEHYISLKSAAQINYPQYFQKQLLFFGQILGLSFNFALLLLFSPRCILRHKRLLLLVAVAVLPISLFYILGHFGQAGYFLAILPILYLLIIFPTKRLLGYLSGRILISILIILEATLFFYPPGFFPLDLNHFYIQQHDARLESFINYFAEVPLSESLIIVLRGEYFNQNKEVQVYKHEDIRALGYYLADFKLYDFLGVPGYYYLVENFSTARIDRREIYFSPQVKQIFILADYLHPVVLPQEFTLERQELSQAVIYRAEIFNLDQFQFYGFDFLRRK